MALTLGFHGGMCCGVKTIFGFPYHPESDWDKHVEYAQEKGLTRNNDKNGDHVTSSKPFFTGEAPKESTADRLARLIAWCKEKRPQGCIEVCLARSSHGQWDQNKLWRPLLEEHGFKETVPEFKNSNSDNWVTIYHLVYDEKAKKKPSGLPNPFTSTGVTT